MSTNHKNSWRTIKRINSIFEIITYNKSKYKLTYFILICILLVGLWVIFLQTPTKRVDIEHKHSSADTSLYFSINTPYDFQREFINFESAQYLDEIEVHWIRIENKQIVPEKAVKVCLYKLYISGESRYEPSNSFVRYFSWNNANQTRKTFGEITYEFKDQCMSAQSNDLFFNIFEYDKKEKDTHPEAITYGSNDIWDDPSVDPLKDSPYFYPFEKFSISVGFTLALSFYAEDGSIFEAKTVTSEILGYVSLTGKGAKVEAVPSSEVQITLYSPLQYRLFTLILMIAVASIIFLLLLVEDLSSFLEVSVGLILGIWGIQKAIVPDYISSQTLIDNFILILYMLFVLMLLFRFFIIPVTEKLEKCTLWISSKIWGGKLHRLLRLNELPDLDDEKVTPENLSQSSSLQNNKKENFIQSPVLAQRENRNANLTSLAIIMSILIYIITIIIRFRNKRGE